jgi:hypothetical protein
MIPEKYHEIFNYFLNALTVFVIIYFIYQYYYEYQAEKEFNANNVTSYNDIEEFNKQYEDTKLCKMFSNLTDRDKEYLYHVINAQRVKYKSDNPKITKKINSFKSQLFYNMLITLLIKQKMGAAFDSIRHNALLNFAINR